MIQPSITIDDKRARKYLSDRPKAMEDKIQRAVERSAFAVVRESKIISPRLTGTMARSIAAAIGHMTATIQPHVNYAIFVHEGTRFMRGRPFMQQGRAAAQSEISRAFEEAVRDAL